MFKRLAKLLQARPAPSIPDAEAGFLQRCVENPEEMRMALAADQSRVAEEIEKTFQMYDAKLQDLASRVHRLSPERLAEETATLKAAQDDLRKVVRRFQASLKSTEELKEELAGWEEHPGGGEWHADHPTVRAEIARSELALRDPEAAPVRGMRELPRPVSVRVDSVASGTSRELEIHAVDPVAIPDEAHLLRAIREATREAERWHALPNHAHGVDALDQVRHVRELNGLLKKIDRQKGIRRDRMAYAVNLKELH